MTKIVCFAGRKQSGKTTLCNQVVNFIYDLEKLEDYSTIYNFADPLKEACRVIFDFDDEQLYGNNKEIVDERWKTTPRDLFQFIGTDVFREFLPTHLPWLKNKFWLHRLEIEYNKLKTKYGDQVNVVVSDIRFNNEAEFVKGLGGSIVKVYRPAIVSNSSHKAETTVKDIDIYDQLIINDTTLENYLEKIKQFASKFIL